jgi:hypothetical protein
MRKVLSTIAFVIIVSFGFASIIVPASGQEKKKPEAAEEKPAKPENTGPKQGPVYGKIATLDKNAKTVGIGKRIFQITGDTKILTEDKKPTTLDAAKIGEYAGGYFRENGSKLELSSLRVGIIPGKKAQQTIESKPSTVPAEKTPLKKK